MNKIGWEKKIVEWFYEIQQQGNQTFEVRMMRVIVGGESGGNSRPCNVDWLEEVVDQCLAGDVSVFVKQMGANPIGLKTKLTDKKGGILEEFPESLQYRQMPTKTN